MLSNHVHRGLTRLPARQLWMRSICDALAATADLERDMENIWKQVNSSCMHLLVCVCVCINSILGIV